MKAYVADHSSRVGFVLANLPEPEPAPGMAVVSVAATSLNRGEVQHLRKQVVPDGEQVGWDFAGYVDQNASDGTGPAPGVAVFGWVPERGSWAERVAVPVAHLAPVPEGLSLVDASCLGVAAVTAYAAVGRCRVALESATVIVTGATGGVGLVALQLALAGGASVVASVRRAEDAEFLSQMVGQPVPVEVGMGPRGSRADLIIDSVGGEVLGNALRRVADGGVVVSLGRTDDRPSELPAGWFLRGARLDGLNVWTAFDDVQDVSTALADLASSAGAGIIRSSVRATVSADDLPGLSDALIERSIQGKAVATWSDGRPAT